MTEGITRVETLTPAQAYFLASDKKFAWFCAGRGSGKCFSSETDFLLHNGSIINVKDIKVGDSLMGYDGKPRLVTSLCSGEDEMYEIKPFKGQSHTVNSEHILTLQYHRPDRNRLHEVFDVSLKDYLAGSNLHRYLFKVPVDFPEQETALDPWIVGAWIGDGSRKSVELNNEDDEVIDAWDTYFSQPQFSFLHRNCYYGKDSKSGKLRQVRYGVKQGCSYNPIRRELRKCIVNNEKRIPKEYLVNSREKRLELLAGLIDTDGSMDKKQNHEFTTKYIGLRDDVLYLCRSLGFSASFNFCVNKSKPKKDGTFSTTWRIYITGKTDQIPCRMEKKRAINKIQVRDVLLTGFEVIPKGRGIYYGFTVKGDGRILLSDFTVTHNTHVGAILTYKMAMRYPKARGLIAANTYHQLHGATLPPVLAYFRDIGLDYRINKRPPESWIRDTPFAIADYKNILVLENGSHIFLRSLDKPEPCRGLSTGWMWIDEISSSTRTAWDILIGTLRDPWSDELIVRVTGSPDGFNWCAEEFEKRFDKDPAISSLYDIVFMSTRENPFLKKEFIDSMLSSYDRRRALQEVDGRILIDQDFNTYYEFRPTIHVKDLIPYNPNQPLILSWDFNSSQNAPMSMIVSQQHQFSNGVPFIQVLDEFVIHGGNTPMVCDTFLKRYYPKHKSSIKVYGDASGTRSTVGTSDFQVVKECLGPRFPSIEFFVPRKNMTVKDRVNAVNAMLLNAKGEIRLFIHPQCKELIEDYKKVKPNNHGLIDKSDPARTHTSDAIGYYIAREFPVKFAAPAGMNSISGLNLNER